MGSGSSTSRARTPACASPAALASSTTSPRRVSSRSRRPASGSIGRLNLDARTQTAYGTLRAFVRFEIARRTGQFHSGTAIRQGNAEPAIGVDFFGQAQHQIVLDKAFIQFAGVTAGRATSFFDFYANDLGWFGIGGGSDRASTNLLAYTASFGSGWSATLSLEDPVERRYPVVTNLGGAALVRGATLFSAPLPAIQIFNPITGLPINSAFVGQQQRNAMPDIVAAVRVDQPWGSAQLSGIVHQISTIGAAIPAGDDPPGSAARTSDLRRRDLHRLPS